MRARFSHVIAASLLVTLWITTPLLAVVHEALEMHRFCVEHERLEEGGDQHGQSETGVAESEASDDSSMQAGGGPSQSGDDHAPCSFDESFTRTCVAGAGAPAIGVLAQAAAVALPPLRASAVLAIDLLRLAPKNSPPRSC